MTTCTFLLDYIQITTSQRRQVVHIGLSIPFFSSLKDRGGGGGVVS